jgi:malonyl-CoA O-methyltransferase
MNLNAEICNSFNKHAFEYEKAAKIQNEIGRRLFERLDLLKINPKFVLDLGCGTGLFTKLLKKKYPKAHVIGLDLAIEMLSESKKKLGWITKWSLVNGDMTSLPFASGLFDLVFANQVIHWSESLPDVLRELSRVMNTNGCLMFSTLGPDTFKELNKAWSFDATFAHSNLFADMHDVGDALMQQRFIDPVVDMEQLTVQFNSLRQLLQSLRAQGVRNINTKRNQGLTGKKAWLGFEKGYEALLTPEKKYPLSYEVVYGHAWKGDVGMDAKGTITTIPINSIKIRTK